MAWREAFREHWGVDKQKRQGRCGGAGEGTGGASLRGTLEEREPVILKNQLKEHARARW